MKHGSLKKIWIITVLVVVVAGSLGVLRRHHVEAQRQYETELEHMYDLLADDPQSRLAATRRAVEKVASLAEDGKWETKDTYYALGLRCYGQQDCAESEDAYRKAIDLAPQWPVAYNGLAILLHHNGRIQEAIQLFREAIKVDPTWERPHNGLAVLYRMAGDYEAAEKEALIAIQLNPDNVAVHNNYGNLLFVQGRLDEALKAYLRASECNPKNPWPLYNIACVFSQLKETDEALDYLARAIAISPVFAEQARNDQDLDVIRDTDRFKALVPEKPASQTR